MHEVRLELLDLCLLARAPCSNFCTLSLKDCYMHACRHRLVGMYRKKKKEHERTVKVNDLLDWCNKKKVSLLLLLLLRESNVYMHNIFCPVIISFPKEKVHRVFFMEMKRVVYIRNWRKGSLHRKV